MHQPPSTEHRDVEACYVIFSVEDQNCDGIFLDYPWASSVAAISCSSSAFLKTPKFRPQELSEEPNKKNVYTRVKWGKMSGKMLFFPF